MRPDFKRKDNDKRGVACVHDVAGATGRAVETERVRKENAFCACSLSGLGGILVQETKEEKRRKGRLVYYRSSLCAHRGLQMKVNFYDRTFLVRIVESSLTCMLVFFSFVSKKTSFFYFVQKKVILINSRPHKYFCFCISGKPKIYAKI